MHYDVRPLSNLKLKGNLHCITKKGILPWLNCIFQEFFFFCLAYTLQGTTFRKRLVKRGYIHFTLLLGFFVWRTLAFSYLADLQWLELEDEELTALGLCKNATVPSWTFWQSLPLFHVLKNKFGTNESWEKETEISLLVVWKIQVRGNFERELVLGSTFILSIFR